MNNRILEAQITPNRLNMERSLLRYILFMLPKVHNRDNFESKKRRMVCHLHKTDYQCISQQKSCGRERVQ